MAGTPETNDRWRRVRAVLEGALDRPVDSRAQFVRASSAGDGDLEREVLELLEAESGSTPLGAALAAGAVVAARAAPIALQPGDRVGQYRLVRVAGAGGMGAVWEAEQEQPRRSVALKVLQHSIASADEVARFRFEADVLARLRHPNIAQIYEVGTLPGGQPFFAMEFVEGARPLGTFAAERELGVAARIDLLLAVCDAVEHGHQRGVIHRDLKSSNVLVDAAGFVKVIDFGIARTVGPEAGEAPQLTRTGQVVGTLLAMAPEQVEGRADAVDVRTDVYALGVILCELLTGRLPLDFTGLSLLEAVRRIREQTPVLPSAVDPALPRELDWIAGKALAKEKERRFASVSELAADLRRFREGDVVLAAPESAWYRLRVFARRHRIGLAAAAVALLSLLAGLGVALRAREREAGARGRAEAALASARAANAFLTGMLASVRPDEAGRDVRVRDVLDAAEFDLGTSFSGPPDVEAAACGSLGASWLALDFVDKAEPHLARALELRRGAGADPRDLLASLRDLGTLRLRQGRAVEAEALLAEGIEGAAPTLGRDDPDVLLVRGVRARVLADLGHGPEAEAEARACLAAFPPEALAADPRRAEVELALIAALDGRGGEDGARAVAEQQHARLLAALGPVHPRTLTAAAALGRALVSAGESEAGLGLMREVVDQFREQLGPDHDGTLRALEYLVSTERHAGRLEECAARVRELIATRTRIDGPRAVRTVQDRGLLGAVLGQLGRFEEARAELVAARTEARSAFGSDDAVTLRLSTWLARVLLDAGAVSEAEAELRAALAESAVVLDPAGPRALDLKETLALVLRDTERAQEGAALMREVLAARRDRLGEGAADTVRAMLHLSGLEALAGNGAAAEELAAGALLGFERMHGREHGATLAARQTLATILARNGSYERAVPLQRDALEVAERLFGAEHPAAVDAAGELGMSLRRTGDPAAAEPLLARCAAGRERYFGADSALARAPRAERAAALLELGRLADARTALAAADDSAEALALLADRMLAVADSAPPTCAGADADLLRFAARLAAALARVGDGAAAGRWRAAVLAAAPAGSDLCEELRQLAGP